VAGGAGGGSGRVRRGDPARPQDRQAITEGKQELKELHEQVQQYAGPFELPDPGEEELGMLREAVQRAAEN
jgi:hypothetical protein